MVTETPEIYANHVRPFMQLKREQGRLNWVWNIIEGRTEQEDVILRDHGGSGPAGEGFLMLPDLNWDRKIMSGLHLLAIVERRDIWSVRDLKKGHIEWLKHMRTKLIDATVGLYPELEADQLKLYIHCEFPRCWLDWFMFSAALLIEDTLTLYLQISQRTIISMST
jgi:m7GpppX diphosphatase